jgi:phage tail sheath protein FI
MTTYQTPGVYREEVFVAAPAEVSTGVPAFLGYAARGELESPTRVSLWEQFGADFGDPLPDSYLADAVRGFFANGGDRCYVVRLDDAYEPLPALRRGLDALDAVEDLDLLCAPDIMRPRGVERLPPDPDAARLMQLELLVRCDRLGDRFAVLDSLPGLDPAGALAQRSGLYGTNGALYYPWVRPRVGSRAADFSPPCGRVAGVYARTDRRFGVHKAPANEAFDDVVDLERGVTNDDQDDLNPKGVNCIRAFPGRGIRIWGARTTSDDPAWTYVSVRRLFITATRWLRVALPDVVFEPNGPELWSRIRRRVDAYLAGLFLRGALQGGSPGEAFFVTCDETTNPPEIREQGRVAVDIGLRAAGTNEFVVVHIVLDASGVTIAGPPRP